MVNHSQCSSLEKFNNQNMEGKSTSSHFFCRLSGRGTVEFVIEKGDGSKFTPVGGEERKTATIQVKFSP